MVVRVVIMQRTKTVTRRNKAEGVVLGVRVEVVEGLAFGAGQVTERTFVCSSRTEASGARGRCLPPPEPTRSSHSHFPSPPGLNSISLHHQGIQPGSSS